MSSQEWEPSGNYSGMTGGWRECLRFAHYCIARDPRSFSGVAVLVFLSTTLILPVPLLSRSVVNLVVDRGDPRQIVYFSLFAVSAIVFERFVSYWHGVVIFRQFRLLLCDLRRQILDHVLQVPMLSLQKEEPVTLSTRIFNDTESALGIFYDNLISLSEGLVTVIVCIVAMAWLELRLSLLVIVAIPIYAILLQHFGGRIRELTAKYYNAIAVDKGLYHHLLASPEIAKIHSHAYIIDSFARSSRRSIAAADDMMKMRAFSYAIVLLIGNVLPVLILLFSAFLILRGSFDIGSFVAFTSFSAYLFPALRRIVEYFVGAQGGVVALARINELLNMEKEKQVGGLSSRDGAVMSLKDVSFRYGNNSRGSLEGVSLELHRGQFIGLMGESGSGKSTLLKVITGLYEPTGGVILVDGSPVSSSTRRLMTSYVEQEPLIFADTLVENIRLGRTDVSYKDVYRILQVVGLADLLQESVDAPSGTGNSTVMEGPLIEQGGANLSLGQKKRIALTRALVKRCPIIVIDEPTAGLDGDNAANALRIIRETCAEKFVIIVSHTGDVMDFCDCVYLIKNGHLGRIHRATQSPA